MGEHDVGRRKDSHPRKSRVWTIFAIFVAIAGVLLLYEHRMHLLTGDALLYVLLALCVGSHFFMHGGHGGHGGHENQSAGDMGQAKHDHGETHNHNKDYES